MRFPGRVWLVCLAILLGLLVLLWLKLRGESAGPISGKESVAGNPAKTLDPEQFIHDLAKAGSGEIHRREAASDRVLVQPVRTLGPLSQRGLGALQAILRAEVVGLEGSIEKQMGAGSGQSDAIGDYANTLRRITELEYSRARLQLLEAGDYITIPLSGNTPDSVPQPPAGVKVQYYGAYELEGGAFAQVGFWVSPSKRPILKELTEALGVVERERRSVWIAEFNALPVEKRRAWVEHYRQLEARATSAGVASMSSDELAALLEARSLVRRLDLNFTPDGISAY